MFYNFKDQILKSTVIVGTFLEKHLYRYCRNFKSTESPPQGKWLFFKYFTVWLHISSTLMSNKEAIVTWP